MTKRVPGLSALARAYGIQTSYYDADQQRQETGAESLLAVLQAFGAPVHASADVPTALRERRLAVSRRITPPVSVVWDGVGGLLDVRLPAKEAPRVLAGALTMEDGRRQAIEWELAGHTPALTEEVEGESFVQFRLSLPSPLSIGYHRLDLESAPANGQRCLILSAPTRVVTGPTRDWGVFIPLHALRTNKDWGIGDYPGLAELSRWSGELGAATVGTLPLLPTFLDGPVEPSPYAPISRLAWNPVFIDPTRIPGAQESEEFAARMNDPAAQREIVALRAAPHVDYARVMALKRRALEAFAHDPATRESLHQFAAKNPTLDDYARFMAVHEARGNSWRKWPEPLRTGRLAEDAYAPDAWAYHLYAQMIAEQQMEALTGNGSGGLYLDYPVGVHPDGFDVWREHDRFVTDVSVGAPPDAFFTRGQDWGFNPLHPERSADHGYFIASLRHHMRYASILRLDHVMGLHRLYWVPRGAGPEHGAYVQYPAEEMYAALALESHRHQTAVVGEDLGTVPPAVPRSMARHGLKRMFVLQFSVNPDKPKPVMWPSRGMVASINTHDTPTFAGYWRGLDIDDRYALGLMDASGAKEEHADRASANKSVLAWLGQHHQLEGISPDEASVMRAAYRGLAASRADLVLVNLEDLWLETEPQNVPGTSNERPNWVRKARYTVEEFTSQSSVRDALSEVSRLRRRNADERKPPPKARGSN